MAVSLRRKIYSRGGSHETTIPLQLLLGLNLEESNEAIFEYDPKMQRWYVRFEKSGSSQNNSDKKTSDKKYARKNPKKRSRK